MKVAVIVVLLLLSAAGVTEGWEAFRGDVERRGYSPTETVPPTPEIAWTTFADAPSSPVVGGLLVFVGTGDGELLALEAHSDRPVWRFKAGDQISTPTYSNGRIYFGSRDNNVYCVSEDNGNLLWKYQTNGPIYSSPAVRGNAVYITSTDNNVYALNASNGSLLWKKGLGAKITSSPAISGDRLYVGTWKGTMCSLDVSTGEVKWEFRPEISGERENYPIVSTPAVKGEIIFFGSNNHYFYAINAAGEKLWEFEAGDKIPSSPSVAENVVYFGAVDGYVYSLWVENGDLRWKFQTGGEIHSSPAVTGKEVVIGSADGYLYNISENGELNWKINVGAIMNNSPALAYGKVFITTADGKIYCIGDWGKPGGDYLWQGLIYLGISAFFLLLLLAYRHFIPEKSRG
ncbi:MAG: PQQ-binding-like beta-propeller repeat protein [Candidatus Hadarchaeales archaeon]